MDLLRKEVQELKEEQFIAGQKKGTGNFYGNDYEGFRAWVPSLTNPRRVNKLTKFFGQEPPLLNIFLKKLGYEVRQSIIRGCSNFFYFIHVHWWMSCTFREEDVSKKGYGSKRTWETIQHYT